MRIVIQPVDGDGERKVTVYTNGGLEKEDEFTIDEYEQAELAIKPHVRSEDRVRTMDDKATSIRVEAGAELVERRRVRE